MPKQVVEPCRGLAQPLVAPTVAHHRVERVDGTRNTSAPRQAEERVVEQRRHHAVGEVLRERRGWPRPPARSSLSAAGSRLQSAPRPRASQRAGRPPRAPVPRAHPAVTAARARRSWPATRRARARSVSNGAPARAAARPAHPASTPTQANAREPPTRRPPKQRRRRWPARAARWPSQLCCSERAEPRHRVQAVRCSSPKAHVDGQREHEHDGGVR
jgi:hypothetical protein